MAVLRTLCQNGSEKMNRFGVLFLWLLETWPWPQAIAVI
jgi:hypothetical protein